MNFPKPQALIESEAREIYRERKLALATAAMSALVNKWDVFCLTTEGSRESKAIAKLSVTMADDLLSELGMKR